MSINTKIIDGVTIYEHDSTSLLASEELRTQRTNTCDSCEHKAGLVCSKCFCIIAAKVSYRGSSCPIEKW
jgi:hypothetical protein